MARQLPSTRLGGRMGFAESLCTLMEERGISANVAAQVPCDKALISRYRNGRQHPSLRMARRVDEVLGAGGQLAALAGEAPVDAEDGGPGDEIGALELARRATATDVGTATVERLERAVDSLAMAYPGTAPGCAPEAHPGASGLCDDAAGGAQDPHRAPPPADRRQLAVLAGRDLHDRSGPARRRQRPSDDR